MGRNKKGKSKDFKVGARPQGSKTDRWDVNSEADLANPKIEQYYKAQKIVPPEEWDEFYNTLKKELPTTFRITGSRATAQDLNHVIQTMHIPNLQGVIFEGSHVPPPTQLPWYPDGLAWQLNVSRTAIRRTPEFKNFHNFLIYETEVGSISRQEAVSMIPPLLLDVQPHHYVLDMCAAPGSKTAQLLEALHANDIGATTSFPPGLLIANDSDYKRANLLVHQSARLPSPALMVTNLDAAIYPHLKIASHFVNTSLSPDPSATVNKSELQSTSATQDLLFDRILCDVPCSGDGTIRKNMMVWKNWMVQNGNGLHSLQLRILQRAMKMLKENGRIVYSTCSLNPIENEAVIAAALTSSRNQFRLVDVSSDLPALLRRPGLRTWSVAVDKEMIMFDTWSAYQEYLKRIGKESKITESQFPPLIDDDDPTLRTDKGSELKGKDLHLERCVRIYPHLQNTGGFFVAVLERIPRVISRTREPEGTSKNLKRPAPEDNNQAHFSVSKKAKSDGEISPVDRRERSPSEVSQMLRLDTPMADDGDEIPAKMGVSFKENPYTYLDAENPLLLECLQQLRILPSFSSTNLFVRNPTGEAVRSMYLCSDVVKAVVQSNDYSRIRLITCGTKVFTRQESGQRKPHFRILDDGVSSVLPYVDPDEILSADLQVLRRFLVAFYPKMTDFPEKFKKTVEDAPEGCSLVRFEAEQQGSVILRHPIVLPIWKSPHSLSLMVDKKAKSALSLRLFGEDLSLGAKGELEIRRIEKTEENVTQDASVSD